MKKTLLLVLEICAMLYGLLIGGIALALFVERIVKRRARLKHLVVDPDEARPKFI